MVTVVETCSPRTVYLVGPTSVGYVQENRVELVIVVDEGDTLEIEDDVGWALVDLFIDGDLSVYTLEEFEECRDNSYTTAYRTNSGVIAYDRSTGYQNLPWDKSEPVNQKERPK